MARLLDLPLTWEVLALHKERDHFKRVQASVKEGIILYESHKPLCGMDFRVGFNGFQSWLTTDSLWQDGDLIVANVFGLRHQAHLDT